MNHENPRWGMRELDRTTQGRSSLRSLINAQLPDTRIFVDRLYREFTASVRRMHTNRLVRNKGNLPWFRADHDKNS